MNEAWLKTLKPRFLLLEDYAGKTPDYVITDLKGEWQAACDEVDRFEILIAYCSVGSWGCDSSAWFLLREKATGELYEASGSHCSCDGFENQFSPEPTTLEYLKSDKFSFSEGGYDSRKRYCYSDETDTTSNVALARAWIKENL